MIAGIHQFKVPLRGSPLEYINVYLIEGEEGSLLVDAGWNTSEALSALEQQIKDAGFCFSDISQIVITHFHPDHYGLAGKLKELSGASLALHQAENSLIKSRYTDIEELLLEMERWLLCNGVPEREAQKLKKASLGVRKFVTPILPEKELKGGEKLSTGIFNFDVIWTPGHSPGHICLYEKNKRILLSGDHVSPQITPHIGYHPQSGDNPLADFINSLKILEKFDVDLVLPGHEYPFSRLQQRIKDIYYHHENRMADILAAIKDEEKTAYQIAAEIPWAFDEDKDMKDVSFYRLNAFDKRLAVLETLSHIQLLNIEGKVKKRFKAGIISFSSVK